VNAKHTLHACLAGLCLLILVARPQASHAQHFGFFGDKNYLWDSIQFTEPREYLFLDTSSANLWQIGEPAKLYFDSAFSAKRAIVTDTLVAYPPNASSYFELVLPIIEFEGIGGAGVIFSYKIDSDSLKDGGYITISFDMGNSWCNFATYADSCYSPEAEITFTSQEPLAFDLLHNGELGFSGRSLVWNKIEFGWIIYGVKSANSGLRADTMLVRFHFASDSIDNPKDGWMIDDIFIYGRERPGGLNHYLGNQLSLYPNPSTGEFSFKLQQSYSQVRARLYHATGQQVAEQICTFCSSIQFDKPHLSKGLYWLAVDLDLKPYGYGKLLIR